MPKVVIIHLDMGLKYASKTFEHEVDCLGLIFSMSGKDFCYDNASLEN